MRIPSAVASRAIGLALLALVGAPGTTGSRSAGAQQATVSGWFHVIWGDPPPGSTGETVTRYLLVDDRGRRIELLLDEELARPFGGPLAFNRQRVTVLGDWTSPPARGRQPRQARPLRVYWIEFERPEEALAAGLGAAAVSGSTPWATILCRFSDSTSVTPHPRSWFEPLMGPVYPGLDHYWRELSYETIDLAGNTVVGWYNLPQPRSYYVYDRDGDGDEDFDHGRAVEDCTAVADPYVYFPDFYGINLMFNQNLGCCAWGGGWTLTRDGQTRNYGVTYMPPWGYAHQQFTGHEMGHGFGLPHSSGPYTAVYDSFWDVMSGGGGCAPPHAEYGCVAVHTIGTYKDRLGWIPASRKYVATAGSSRAIILERLSQPASPTNSLVAQIPIVDAPGEFYTAEARRFVGYDVQVPGEAIVIHRVTLGGARVVDPDANGNPNDEGAMWVPGELFVDGPRGIAISVDRRVSSGFQVTVTYAPLPDLAETAVSSPPVTASPGSAFSARDTVRNQGPEAAGASTTRYYLSLDRSRNSGDMLLADRSVPGLAPGATSTGTVTVVIPSTIGPGTYYLLACSDDLGAVSEANEANNCRASTRGVKVLVMWR